MTDENIKEFWTSPEWSKVVVSTPEKDIYYLGGTLYGVIRKSVPPQGV